MANQYAIQDQNQFPAEIIHSGTTNTASTIRRTGQTNGSGNSHITGGTVDSNLVGRWGTATGNVDDVATDGAFNALITVGDEHHEIHGGDHYFVISYQDLSNNQVLQFTWQMPDTTKWIHWDWKIDTESEMLWEVYEGGTINSALANSVAMLNNNRNSANTSATTMKYQIHANTSAADTAVDVSGATLTMCGLSGAGKDAGQSKRENEMILKQNQLYVLRATAHAAGFINFDMQWYEHTNTH